MLQLTETSETFKKLNKTNTERLLVIFVKKFNAYPANPFDRKAILVAIKNHINEEIANRINEKSNLCEEQASIYILKQIKAAQAGKELGNQMRDSDIIAIRALHEDGLSFAKIGDMYNKKSNYIRNICIGKLYKSVK
jgi:hypothetical protein